MEEQTKELLENTLNDMITNIITSPDAENPSAMDLVSNINKVKSKLKNKTITEEKIITAINGINTDNVESVALKTSVDINKQSLINMASGTQPNTTQAKENSIFLHNDEKDDKSGSIITSAITSITNIFKKFGKDQEENSSVIGEKFGNLITDVKESVSSHTSEVLGDVQSELIDPVKNMGMGVMNFLAPKDDTSKEHKDEAHKDSLNIMNILKDGFASTKDWVTDKLSPKEQSLSMTNALTAYDKVDEDDEKTSSSMSGMFDFMKAMGKKNARMGGKGSKAKDGSSGGMLGGIFGEFMGGTLTTILMGGGKAIEKMITTITNGLKFMLKPFTYLIDKFTSVFSWTKNLTILDDVAVTGAKVTKSVGVFGKAFAGISKMFGSIIRWLGPIGIAIGVIMSAVDFIKGFVQTQGDMFDKLTGGIKSAIMGLFTIPLKFIGWIGDKILGIFGVEIEGGFGKKLVDGFGWYMDKILDITMFIPRMIWKGVKTIWNSIKWIGEVIDGIAKILFLPFKYLWKSVSKTVGILWSGIKWVGDIIKGVIDILLTPFNMVWGLVKSFFDGILPTIDKIETIFDSILGGIHTAFFTPFEWLGGIFGKLGEKISTLVSSVKDFLWNLIPGGKWLKKVFGDDKVEKTKQEKIEELRAKQELAKSEFEQKWYKRDGKSKEDYQKEIDNLQQEEKAEKKTSELIIKKETREEKEIRLAVDYKKKSEIAAKASQELITFEKGKELNPEFKQWQNERDDFIFDDTPAPVRYQDIKVNKQYEKLFNKQYITDRDKNKAFNAYKDEKIGLNDGRSWNGQKSKEVDDQLKQEAMKTASFSEAKEVVVDKPDNINIEFGTNKELTIDNRGDSFYGGKQKSGITDGIKEMFFKSKDNDNISSVGFGREKSLSDTLKEKSITDIKTKLTQRIFSQEKSLSDTLKEKSLSDTLKEKSLSDVSFSRLTKKKSENREKTGFNHLTDSMGFGDQNSYTSVNDDEKNRIGISTKELISSKSNKPMVKEIEIGAALGGIVQKTGLVKIHAGEVIGPLKDVRNMIQTETFNEFEDYIKNKTIQPEARMDVGVIDRLLVSIGLKKSQEQQENKQLQQDTQYLLEKNSVGMKQEISKLVNVTKETNNNSTVVSTGRGGNNEPVIPTNIEDIGIYLTNANWI